MDGIQEDIKCLQYVGKYTGLPLCCQYSYSKKKCRCLNCKEYKRQDKIKYSDFYEKWNKDNPDYYKEYGEKNKVYIAEKTRLWRKNNPEKKLENVRQRKMLKKSVLTENYLVSDVVKKYGSACHICGVEIDMLATKISGKPGWENGLHIDHLIPISKGGQDSIDNVRPSHAICNLKKGSRQEFNYKPKDGII